MGLLDAFDRERNNRRIAAILATSRARRRAHATKTDQLRELEAELARVRLLAFTLAELCIEKGVVTAQELETRLTEVDRSDGAEDDGLSAGRPLPGSTPA